MQQGRKGKRGPKKKEKAQEENSRLGLGYVDNRAAHAADEYHTALGTTVHQVTGNGSGEEVGAVEVDSEQLAHTLDGVVDGLEVLGEPSRGHKVVNFAVLGEDFSQTGVDAVEIRDVGVVSRDLGDPASEWLSILVVKGEKRGNTKVRGNQLLRVGVVLLELVHQSLSLNLGLLLCNKHRRQLHAPI